MRVVADIRHIQYRVPTEVFLDAECVVVSHRLLPICPPEIAVRSLRADVPRTGRPRAGEVRAHVRVTDHLRKIERRSTALDRRTTGSLVKRAVRRTDRRLPIAERIPR